MRDGISARGGFGLGVSAGAAFSVCATVGCAAKGASLEVGPSSGSVDVGGDCTVANGASLEVGPSSDSVDVDVFVRYNAVCKANSGL